MPRRPPPAEPKKLVLTEELLKDAPALRELGSEGDAVVVMAMPKEKERR